VCGLFYELLYDIVEGHFLVARRCFGYQILHALIGLRVRECDVGGVALCLGRDGQVYLCGELLVLEPLEVGIVTRDAEVAARRGDIDGTLKNRLLNRRNWYLQWKGQIGLY
jgi:hypothetical protein